LSFVSEHRWGRALVPCVGLVIALASGASAGVFDPPNSTLTLRIAGLGGVGIAAGAGTESLVTIANDGSGGHVVTDSTSVWSTVNFGVGTSFFTGVPIVSDIRGTVHNLAGAFSSSTTFANPVGPGTPMGFGGYGAISGQLVLSALSGLVQIPAPLDNLGQTPGLTQMVTLGGLGQITATFGPWVTVPFEMTDITTNLISLPGRGGATGGAFTLQPTPSETIRTFSTGGGFVSTGGGSPVETHSVTLSGTNQLVSASKAGSVTLITPIRIDTGALAGRVPGAAEKRITFIPEAGSLALWLTGAAALCLAGWRRRR